MEDTKKKLIALLQQDIDREQIGIDLYCKVLALVEKMEGQKISKRIETAFKKENPAYAVHYAFEYGMYYLKIWGNGIEYKNMISLLLGYDSGPFFKVGHYDPSMLHADEKPGFKTYSCCYGEAAERRNESRRAVIKNDKRLTKIAAIVDNLKKAHEDFWNLDIESMYRIQKEFSLPDKFAR